MSGRQASGTVSGAPLSSPPCHPRGPTPVPTLALGTPAGSLTQSGRPLSDVVERLTRRTADFPLLYTRPHPFPNFFFLYGTRDRLKITERCGRPGDLRG